MGGFIDLAVGEYGHEHAHVVELLGPPGGAWPPPRAWLLVSGVPSSDLQAAVDYNRPAGVEIVLAALSDLDVIFADLIAEGHATGLHLGHTLGHAEGLAAGIAAGRAGAKADRRRERVRRWFRAWWAR